MLKLSSDNTPLSFKDVKTYLVNPFRNETIKLVSKSSGGRTDSFVANHSTVTDNDTGEMKSVWMGTRKTIDKESFTKVYHSNIGQMFGIGGSRINLLFYIFKQLTKNSDEFILYPADACQDNSISIPTFYACITDLINAGIIAKHKKPNRYFINPTLCFNGDRMIIYKEYIREDSDLAKKPSKLKAKSPGRPRTKNQIKPSSLAIKPIAQAKNNDLMDNTDFDQPVQSDIKTLQTDEIYPSNPNKDFSPWD